MSNTVRFQVEQKELDSSNNVYDDISYLFDTNFTNYSKQEFSISSGNVWQSISFGKVTTSSAISIENDQTIKITLNSGSEEFTITKGLIIIGQFTSLSIKNNSGNTANLTIKIYG